MRMPNADRAVVDFEKLSDYCLSMEHPRGRHKARVFAAALGITAEHAEEVRSLLLIAALRDDATATDADEYGQRYVIDFPMQGAAGEAVVRSAWIVRKDEDFPRFVSCYVV
jgi:hypothetical protein